MTDLAILGWYSVIALCLVMYVVLDGYDLGLGILTLGDTDERRRRENVDLVATAWDGNESWIILLGVSLWAGLPGAYAVALPALYLPVIVMLLAIIARGVAVEAAAHGTVVPRSWGLVFGLGSLVAAVTQGLIMGGLLSGVRVEDGEFAGGTWDFLTPFSLLTAAATVALYVTAAAAVLQVKDGYVARPRVARTAATLTVALVAACAVMFFAWEDTWPRPGGAQLVVATVLALVGAAAMVLLMLRCWADRGPQPVVLLTIGEVAGMTGVLVYLHPVVVPPELTLPEVAAPPSSIGFLLVGVGLNIPLVLFYNWYAHHVFRGKYVPRTASELPEGVSPASEAVRPRGSEVR